MPESFSNNGATLRIIVSNTLLGHLPTIVKPFPGFLGLRNGSHFVFGAIQPQRVVSDRRVHIVAMMRLGRILMLVRPKKPA
jgi:hypothetical protein